MPSFQTDLIQEALAALRRGDFAAARSSIRAHNQDHPREAQHYLIEGLATLAMADWPAARDLFDAATAAFADQAQFWFNRGLAEENLGMLDAAVASYQQSLELKPDQGNIFGNLSNIYRRQGRFPEAVQMACRAIAAGAPQADAMNALGLALGKQGNYSEAQRAFDEALQLQPDDAAILANRANLAADQLKFDEAWGFFAAARAADDLPVIRRDEGIARLLAGDFEAGLRLYEARLELPHALRMHPSCPRWQRENLAGKTLLLIAEQGFGDTIQFSRYAGKLADAGAHLIWIVREPLRRLLASNLPGSIITEEEIAADRSPQTEILSLIQQADFWLPILSLPFALGMKAPMPAPLIFKAPAEAKLPDVGKRKIGIVWSGSPTHERDRERSIPLGLLLPALEKIDAQFYAVMKDMPSPRVIPAQAGIQADQPHDIDGRSFSTVDPLDSGFRRNDADGTGIVRLDHLIHDFADTAALLAQLDCLITVDTAAAHLAGALGVTTYLLLPHCPDWRWGAAGDTTAWYPTMRLVRQPAYGDWYSVIQTLGGILP